MSNQPHDSDGTTVADAARVLGISEGAVRKRVERGKLSAERTPDGRLLVFFDATTTDATRDTTHDRPRPSRGDRYTRSLEDQVEYLRRQLERRDGSCENTADCWPASSNAYPSWRPPPRRSPQKLLRRSRRSRRG